MSKTMILSNITRSGCLLPYLAFRTKKLAKTYLKDNGYKYNKITDDYFKGSKQYDNASSYKHLCEIDYIA